MTPQQDMATYLFWFLIILTAMVWAGIWIAHMIKSTRIEDAYPTPPAGPHTCQIGKCGKRATTTFDRHPAGSIHVCPAHDQAVQGWVGPYGRDVPYNQETDVTEFEGEWKNQ
jgi:hypothetical protein